MNQIGQFLSKLQIKHKIRAVLTSAIINYYEWVTETNNHNIPVLFKSIEDKLKESLKFDIDDLRSQTGLTFDNWCTTNQLVLKTSKTLITWRL